MIDHLGKPPIASGEVDAWASALREACEPPNVHAKLSGLNTAAAPGRWSAADLQPYVDVALDVLGPDRLLFGSDWPVLLLDGTSGSVAAETLRTLDGLSAGEAEAIRRGTATRLYRLDAP